LERFCWSASYQVQQPVTKPSHLTLQVNNSLLLVTAAILRSKVDAAASHQQPTQASESGEAGEASGSEAVRAHHSQLLQACNAAAAAR
jgi:hypothetical protein